MPTSAQLTLTILRIGEANKAPLPPPPPNKVPPDSEETATKDESKKTGKLVGFIKGTTKAGVRSVLGVDRIKATVGSEPSKRRMVIVRPSNTTPNKSGDGPAIFTARHHGKKGRLVISTSATTPCLAFERISDNPLSKSNPIFSIAIDDITELEKIGGLGWKSMIIVGWALGTEVADGLEIMDVKGKGIYICPSGRLRLTPQQMGSQDTPSEE